MARFDPAILYRTTYLSNAAKDLSLECLHLLQCRLHHSQTEDYMHTLRSH